MSERQRRTVALVLTHNAPHSLARCIAAIDAQPLLPDEIVVIDNASQPPVDAYPVRGKRSIGANRALGHQWRAGWRMGIRVTAFLEE